MEATSLPRDPSTTRTALVLVDVQTCYFSDKNGAAVRRSFPDFPHRVARVLSWAREQRLVVVHVLADYDDGHSPFANEFRAMNPDKTFEARPDPESFAAPAPGEAVVHKPTMDGFLHTNLQGVLQGHGVQQVLVCGLLTSACVLFTAQGAFARGFSVVLVHDACADRGIERHRSVLSLYGNYIYKVASTSQLASFANAPQCPRTAELPRSPLRLGLEKPSSARSALPLGQAEKQSGVASTFSRGALSSSPELSSDGSDEPTEEEPPGRRARPTSMVTSW